jgi:hypothetical protein
MGDKDSIWERCIKSYLAIMMERQKIRKTPRKKWSKRPHDPK